MENKCAVAVFSFFFNSFNWRIEEVNKIYLNKWIWGVCYFCHLYLKHFFQIFSGHSNTQKGKDYKRNAAFVEVFLIQISHLFLSILDIRPLLKLTFTTKPIKLYIVLQTFKIGSEELNTLCYFRPFRIQEKYSHSKASFLNYCL